MPINTDLNIDLEQFKPGIYDPNTAMFYAGSGEHPVKINIINIPRDMSAHIEAAKSRMEEYKKAYDESRKNHGETQEKLNEAQRQIRELQGQQNNSEDRARPPLPNETLQAMLQLMNGGRDYTQEINQIQVVRLLTGWGLREAQGFVRSNRPPTPVPVTDIDE